jgi:hypothetical protein
MVKICHLHLSSRKKMTFVVITITTSYLILHLTYGVESSYSVRLNFLIQVFVKIRSCGILMRSRSVSSYQHFEGIGLLQSVGNCSPFDTA